MQQMRNQSAGNMEEERLWLLSKNVLRNVW